MTLTVVTALLIVVGLVGIVVPVVPGLLLTVLATLLWAYEHTSPQAWWVFGLAVLWYAAGVIAQYLIPGRRMRQQGIRTSTMLLAVALGIVGFFVIPVVGAIVGFVLGIFLVEYARVRQAPAAWARGPPRTRPARPAPPKRSEREAPPPTTPPRPRHPRRPHPAPPPRPPASAHGTSRCQPRRRAASAASSMVAAFTIWFAFRSFGVDAGIAPCAVVAVFLGTILGALAGFYGKWIDDVMNWFYNIFTSIPYLLLILAIAAVLNTKGMFTIILILGLTGWTGTFRLIRGEYLKHKEREYVRAADAIGASNTRRMFVHTFPNVSHVVLVQISIPVSYTHLTLPTIYPV